MFFKDKLKPLPIDYNLVLAFLWRHPDKVGLNRVKVVHYCAAGSKPWRYTGKEENMDREDIKMLVKKWWDVYEDPSLDHNSAEAAVSLKPFREALVLSPLVFTRVWRWLGICKMSSPSSWDYEGSPMLIL